MKFSVAPTMALRRPRKPRELASDIETSTPVSPGCRFRPATISRVTVPLGSYATVLVCFIVSVMLSSDTESK